MKKFILILLLGACFNNNKDISKNNKDLESEVEKDSKPKIEKGLESEVGKDLESKVEKDLIIEIPPITLEHRKTYQAIFNEENFREINKEKALFYALGEKSLFYEDLEKIKSELGKNPKSDNPNFVKELKDAKTRCEVKELVSKYYIGYKESLSDSYPKIIFKIRDNEMLKYIKPEEQKDESNFSYFFPMASLNRDRKEGILYDLYIIEIESSGVPVLSTGRGLSYCQRFEEGVYYYFNVPLELREVDPLPNEYILRTVYKLNGFNEEVFQSKNSI